MKAVEKTFIVIAVVLILLVSGGIYVNNKIDKILESSQGLGVFLIEAQGGGKSARPNQAEPPLNHGQKSQSGEISIKSGDKEPSASDLVFDENVESIIQTKLDKPIERKDKIKVALILIKRLSVDDITFFYDLITLGNYSDEDITRARKILTANLNEEELATLSDLADKYSFTP